MRRLLAVLLWSALSAAFLGPGTVTTAAQAGASHRFELVWALVFGIVACVALQEAAARLTIVSGKPLGRAVAEGWRTRTFAFCLVGSVVIGCAAYEAGNVLGGVAGLRLMLPEVLPMVLTGGAGLVAALALLLGAPGRIARVLGVVVALMGLAFLYTAIRLHPPLDEVAAGVVTPSIPPGGDMLTLALVGTTVVPYNLFLGSGLARGESLPMARFGISVAVVLGGVISVAVLVAGSAVEGTFGFPQLAAVLEDQGGVLAAGLFAFGLASAGLSSAITAPLAAGLAISGVLPEHRVGRAGVVGIALGVLAFGLGFGLAGVRPVPVIIAAQALNGFVLPAVALFLLIAVNDRSLMGDEHLNGRLGNTVLAVTALVAVTLGVRGVVGALVELGVPQPPAWGLVAISLAAAGAIAPPVVAQIVRRRRAVRREPPGDRTR
jgi:Mn2+/Fe2+ NRAMP family transporter